jgi:hypothetical protein
MDTNKERERTEDSPENRPEEPADDDSPLGDTDQHSNA